MRRDYLIERLIESVARERVLLLRVTRYVLPLLLLPVGFALAQMVRGWLGLVAGGVGAGVLLMQIGLFIRPTLVRVRVIDQDVTWYLGLAGASTAPSLAPAVRLLVPSAVVLAGSMVVFLPTILASARPWQRLLALALGLFVLWAIWQRLADCVTLLDRLDARLAAARQSTTDDRQPMTDDRRPTTDLRDTVTRRPGDKVTESGDAITPSPLHPFTPSEKSVVSGRWSVVGGQGGDGLLDPVLARRLAGLPLPPLLLSPAALALLRVEAYLLLRDFPTTTERELLDALAGLAQEAHQAELRHWLLPPVGGKLYLPVAAQGMVATLLAATVRRFGMEGAYSASLGTWLVRLPPARSYVVAGRLLDALVALRLPPPGAILPHHLTVQGDLSQASKLLSLLYLVATPVLFAERPGHAQDDERPFIMRGGGVLDDMGGRGRLTGPRTDFVDGFLFVETPGLMGAEHLSSHTINLRVKQVLAFGVLAGARPAERRAPAERAAAVATMRLRTDLRAFLARYDLERALDIPWLDGRWSEIWPLLARMSDRKEHDPGFLPAAQHLRDTALDAIEAIAIEATRQTKRPA